MAEAEFLVVPGLVDGCDTLDEPSPAGLSETRNGELILASGWIVSLDAPIERVWVSVDGERGFPARLGFERPDVVGLGFEDQLLSGFQALVPVDGWSPGEHALTVEAIDVDGRFLRGDGEPHVVTVLDDAVDSPFAISRIEEVRVADVAVDPDAPIAAAPNSSVFVRGWMIAPDFTDGIAAFLRSDRLIPLSYGVERADVAAYYGGGARKCGFVGSLSRAALGEGPSRYDLVLLSADGRSLLVADSSLEFTAAEPA
jgi:hypothetical protein